MAIVCDNSIDKLCVRMLLVTYENYGKNVKSSQKVMMLPSAKEGDINSCPGLLHINKTTHEIRTALNIIIGYSELMLEGVLGRITEEQGDGIKDVLASSRHILDLVNDFSCNPNQPR